jgi:hypothetical protein
VQFGSVLSTGGGERCGPGGCLLLESNDSEQTALFFAAVNECHFQLQDGQGCGSPNAGKGHCTNEDKHVNFAEK